MTMDIKNLNLKKYRDNLLFIPLGGSNEIGLNCNLYHYHGKWIMVDCGIGFTKAVPGVDLMVPDISLLQKFKNNLLGVFITHIHEDHLGAIQYLWPSIKSPIYASRFAKIFLQEKLREYEFKDEVKINEIKAGDNIKLDPFEIEFIGLTHSTPEMNALLIKTERGNILHSGDWKFDNNPVIGEKSDIKRLKKLGSRHEVLATVCESTNIFNDSESRSESELLGSFLSLTKNKNGLLVFTTFASNVSRIKTIIALAKKLKRKIVIVGSALNRLMSVAKRAGYIEDTSDFIAETEIKKYKKQNLILIATGCQGNINAAIDKLANDAYRYVKLSEGDCVIFSSKVIPGNEKDLLLLYNRLAEKDVEAITEKSDFVHVSGHYTLDDLKKFYGYVKPKIAIAVHGEPVQLMEHQKVARACGIRNIAKTKNGVILKIGENGVEKVGQIGLQNMLLDGQRLLSAKSGIIGARIRLQEVGCIFINMIISSKYKIVQNPVISAPGGYDFSADGGLKNILQEDIVQTYNAAVQQINETRKTNKNKFLTNPDRENFIGQKIRAAVNKFYLNDVGKKPLIEIFFTKISLEQK